ncbi:hypothetical protein P0D73_42170 [Paraburkholderia sp. RL18-101-BIB-B]|uniref:hypothetical protein n=1 Tax=unclassified Paraburkholderia TaxID=2615204 RepID=UPI0038BB6880
MLATMVQGLDPFLRAATDTLISVSQTAAVEVGCLEDFADVIASHVSYHYSRSAHASDPEILIDQHILMRINIHISEHIAENILIEHLAALVHTSPSHFACTLRKAPVPHSFSSDDGGADARQIDAVFEPGAAR